MNELLKTALDWRERGVHCIPLKPQSKVSAVKWAIYQAKRPSKKKLYEWFSNGKVRNIAVLCGAVSSNLCILDFDSIDAWRSFRLEHREKLDTFQVKTSRGRHLYYKVANLPGSSFSVPGVDIKVSGYCLTYPSIHPSGAEYVVTRDCPIMEVGSVVDLLGSGLEMPERVKSCYKASDEGAQAVEEATGSSDDTFSSALQQIERSSYTLCAAIKERLPIEELLEGRIIGPSETNKDHELCECPLHSDSTPSAWLNRRTQRFGCYSTKCPSRNRPLDTINLFAFLHEMSNSQAILALAKQLGIT